MKSEKPKPIKIVRKYFEFVNIGRRKYICRKNPGK